MKIELKKFGEILMSRSAGREAALSLRAYFKPKDGEELELDFEGVLSVGPSWLDEVLSVLYAEYGKDRVKCLPTQNTSVLGALKTIEEQHNTQG